MVYDLRIIFLISYDGFRTHREAVSEFVLDPAIRSIRYLYHTIYVNY